MAKPKGGLTKWFKENWVDISRPKKGGGYMPCGRKTSKKGKYPKCVPASKAARMTKAQKDQLFVVKEQQATPEVSPPWLKLLLEKRREVVGKKDNG